MNNTIMKSIAVTLLVSSCLLSGCNSKSKNSCAGVSPQVLMQERQKNAQLQATVRNLGAGMQAMGNKLSHVTNSLAQTEREKRLMAQYVIAAHKRHQEMQQKLQAAEKKNEKAKETEKAKADKAPKESLALLNEDAKKVEKEPKESLSFLNEDAAKVANKQSKQRTKKLKASAAYYRAKSNEELKKTNVTLKKLEKYLVNKDVRRRVKSICRLNYPSKIKGDNFCKAYNRLLKKVRKFQQITDTLMANNDKDKGERIFNMCSSNLHKETKVLAQDVRKFDSHIIACKSKPKVVGTV